MNEKEIREQMLRNAISAITETVSVELSNRHTEHRAADLLLIAGDYIALLELKIRELR